MSIHNDILLLKIKRDFNNKNKNSIYQRLIDLFKNILFYKNALEINLSELEQIVKYNNVRITNMSHFEYLYLENEQIFSKFVQVGDIMISKDSFVDKIKNNNKYLFYIFTIIDNNYRFAQIEDKNYSERIRQERKEKLLNIPFQ